MPVLIKKPLKGLISVITGLITAQKAKISTVKTAKESTFDQISSVALRFFTSLDLIKTTICVVSTVVSQLQLSVFSQGTVLTTSMMCTYGLSLSVGNLAGSTFLNFACLGAADIVGKVLLVIFVRFYPSEDSNSFSLANYLSMFESTLYKTQKVANYSFIYLTWHHVSDYWLLDKTSSRENSNYHCFIRYWKATGINSSNDYYHDCGRILSH